MQTHLEDCEGEPFSLPFLVRLNPTRLLGVVRLLLQFGGGATLRAREPASPLLARCERCAGHLMAHACTALSWVCAATCGRQPPIGTNGSLPDACLIDG